MQTDMQDSTIRVIEGSIIPNFHVQNTDVMMMEEEITDEIRQEMWKQDYTTQLAFMKSPQMPVCVFDPLSSGIKTSLQAMSANQQQGNILKLMRQNAEQIYLRLGFFVPSIFPAEYEEAANDPDFIIALLPKNWLKVEGGGSVNWTDIIDSLSRTRMRCYITNNRMERKAYFQLIPRFSIKTTRTVRVRIENDPDPTAAPARIECHVVDQHKYIYTTSGFDELDLNEARQRELIDLQMLEAHKWLQENYPEWKSPFSYWD